MSGSGNPHYGSIFNYVAYKPSSMPSGSLNLYYRRLHFFNGLVPRHNQSFLNIVGPPDESISLKEMGIV